MKLHPLLLSLLSGILLAAAWPVNGFTPLIFVALVPLMVLQHRLGESGKRGMFWYSWLAFAVWNGITTWWIWYSTQAGAVAAIVINALFSAVVFQVYHISKKRLFNNRRGFGIVIFYWITWEYFHTNWDLTWPWLTLGNVFASKHTWIQWYEYTGVFGGSLWVLLSNVLIVQIILRLKERGVKQVIIPVLLWTILITVPLVISHSIYNNYKEGEQSMEVVVVQPNIDPYTEEFNLPPTVVMERIFKLADKKISDSTLYVVCPESAIQEGIWEENLQHSTSIKLIERYISYHPQTSFVIGASTYRMLGKGEKLTNAARKYRDNQYYYAYNTAFQIDNTGFVQVHHKSKLTPGVERMPSWWILKPLEQYAIDLGGITGTLKDEEHPTVFENKKRGVKVSPIICYESVFGEFTAKTVSAGSNAIFVITNDGWWGDTPGYKQHFLFSVLRAIETRRSVARAANTGTSAFINQRGDIREATPFWKQASIKERISLNDKLTFYVKYGDVIARISAFISFFVLLISFTQDFLKKRENRQHSKT